MEINKNITNTNKTIMNNKENKYIVIHYVGAVSSAYNNTLYFKDENRGASAHYFVDDTSIWQCVEEKDASWHTGTNGKYYSNARNNNSIGIEMCCFDNNGTLDISEATIYNTVELVKEIMKKYNIPVNNVITHYDVTRKKCPAPFINNVERWNNFKNKLLDYKNEEEKNINIDVIYQTYDNKKKKWLNNITNYNNKNILGYAGNIGNSIGGVRVKLNDNSKILIKSHIKGGKWLSEINKWDNTSNGYSGIKGKSIDAIMIKSDKHNLEYRVHLLKDNRWLGWVKGYNTNDKIYGYAGNLGKEIDAIQIKVLN